MFKLLTYIILGYFAYKLFLKPFFEKINPPSDPKLDQKERKTDDEEYVDYEEIE